MKDKEKQPIVPPILPPEFEAAMRRIANTPKEEVEKAIGQEKKGKKGAKKR